VASSVGAFDVDQPYLLTVDVVPYSPPPPLVVTTTDDVDDGACNASHCSLREAFNAVNAGDATVVEFDIPRADPGFDGSVWTIAPAVLPVLTQPLRLDGTTQTLDRGDTNPLGPEIVLDGGGAGSGAVGLDLQGAGPSTVVSLVVSNWSQAGVRAVRSRQLTVHGCYIGTDATGARAAGNRKGLVLSGGHSHHIGGAGEEEGNVISGNTGVGLHLFDTATSLVYGNRIGTDRSGVSAVGNGSHGVLVSGGSEYVRIGGSEPGQGNVISANRSSGVLIEGHTTQYNKVLGNSIGTSVDGARALGNGANGVTVDDGVHNEIGGVGSGEGNLIAGNAGHGVYLEGADLNAVAGNRIGTSSPAGTSLGNGDQGVRLDLGSRHNTVGPGNAISRNASAGVMVYGNTSDFNTITRNSITGNGGHGISLGGGVNIGNENIREPVVSDVGADSAEGVACPRCTVEVFSDEGDEGGFYEGTVTALATGEWRWEGSRRRDAVQATATDSRGNTSRFSTCFDSFELNDDMAHAPTLDTPARLDAFICSPADVDMYRVSADAGSVIVAELSARRSYRLLLRASDGSVLAAAGDLSDGLALRRIVHTVTESGEYFVQVESLSGSSSSDLPYTLEVAADTLNTDLRLFLDEGAFLQPAVYKLIPDDAGATDVAYVDVVAEVTVDGSLPVEPVVTIEIPDDALGFPVASGVRDCRGCALAPVTFFSDGPGRYRATLSLGASSPPLKQQLVLRFAIVPSDPVGDVIPTAEVRYDTDGEVVGSATAPPIHLVHQVPAIVISSRHHLYGTSYDVNDAEMLLAEVTFAAQGPPDGPSGSMPAAVYYVDDYSSAARAWDNTSWSTASERAANSVTREIDTLLEDWIEDADDVDHVVILGDDDVIPMYRRACPCDGTESDVTESDPVIGRVVNNDFILTDNHFGDTDHSDWDKGELELNVGRIVGDTADAMRYLFAGGLYGPSPGPSPRAVLASWDGPELDLGGSGSSVLDHVRAWGYSASSALVDNDDWRKNDLLDALRDQFTIFLHADHGNPFGLGAPSGSAKTDSDFVDVTELTGAISSAASRRPFYGFEDCRVGLTLGSGTLVDQLLAEGASGVVANAGISWHSCGGSEWYTEEVFNRFVRRAMPGSGSVRTVGRALRLAKSSYSALAGWYCRDKTAVQEITLYGVPWMTIPGVPSKAGVESPGLSSTRGSLGTPRSRAEDSYEVTTTVGASDYSIDEATAPGFELVRVEGFALHHFDGPVLPAADLELLLPPESQVTAVEVTAGDPLELGALDIPSYSPGVLLVPNGSDDAWTATPASVGMVPEQPFSWEVRSVDDHLVVHLHLVPVSFEAATRRTVLHRRLEVRVVYRTPEPTAVTDFGIQTRRAAPGAPVSVRASVMNASDASAAVTTALRVVDLDGSEVARSNQGPFTIPAGGTDHIDLDLAAPEVEGSYSVRLDLERSGTTVARAADILEVSEGRLSEVVAPATVLPGTVVELGASYTNTTSAPRVVGFRVRVTDPAGRTEDDLGEVLRTIAGGAVTTISFPWDGTTVPLGRHHVVVEAIPDGGIPRKSVAVIETVRRPGLRVRRAGGRVGP
jgi:CSLREA domain-containing protein